jgi:hypothetical protein
MTGFYHVGMGCILGWDIGGANIKAATPDGRTWHEPFALWKEPTRLPVVLREIQYRFPDADRFHVTMTGELCDCFETKRIGVNAILDAVEFEADGRPVRVWGTDGQFHDVDFSRANPLKVAAANWHALATFAGQYAPTRDALLIDIGSTTTDVIALSNGFPATLGLSDFDRLTHRELVYTGTKRTPLCALAGDRAAAEFFATIHDVNVILGLLPEEPTNTETADQRPMTVDFAFARVARMLGGDRESHDDDRLIAFAVELHREQVRRVTQAIRAVRDRLSDLQTIVLSGEGEFLAHRALRDAIPDFPEGQIVSLTTKLGNRLSQSAPAYAVAKIS